MTSAWMISDTLVGTPRGGLHRGGAHAQDGEEQRHDHRRDRMQLADQRHGHAVKAVARAEAVDEAELRAEQLWRRRRDLRSRRRR